MITERQTEFHVLAERLLAEVERTPQEHHPLNSAAAEAVDLAKLAAGEADAPAGLFDQACRLLSAHEFRPGWAQVRAAGTVRRVIAQHVESAAADRRAAAEAAEAEREARAPFRAEVGQVRARLAAPPHGVAVSWPEHREVRRRLFGFRRTRF